MDEPLSLKEPESMSDGMRHPTLFKRIKGAVLYAAFLLLLVGGLMEVFSRTGIIRNDMQRFRSELRKLNYSPDVVIAGDSFSIELPSALTALLRQEFSRHGLSTLNLAVAGTGPTNYLSQLKLFGTHGAPRLILVNYYAGNDIIDTHLRVLKTPRFRKAVRSAAQSSYFATFLLDLRLDLLANRRLGNIDVLKADHATGINPFLYDTARRYPEYIRINHTLNDGGMNAWEVNEKTLLEINRMSESRGAKVIFSIFPSTLQVSDQHVGFYRRVGFDVPEGLASTTAKPQQLFMNFCAREGLNCIDLLPAFRQRVKQEGPFYLEKDDHWSEAGNRVAFDVISRHLKNANLIPSESVRSRVTAAQP
jgi:hypothetical protein